MAIFAEFRPTSSGLIVLDAVVCASRIHRPHILTVRINSFEILVFRLFGQTPTRWMFLKNYVSDTPSFAISREPGFGFPVREGMPVSLKCDVDANPKASPVWQKDDTDPPVQQTPDGFLNFTEIKRDHSGWYKCISTHLLGRFSSIGYFLNVRCKYL